jgi:hypothetical protein
LMSQMPKPERHCTSSQQHRFFVFNDPQQRVSLHREPRASFQRPDG